MRRQFDGFQLQFHRLEKERMEIDEKVQRDKEKSDMVYRMLNKDEDAPGFYEVLKSGSLAKKKKYLGM